MTYAVWTIAACFTAILVHQLFRPSRPTNETLTRSQRFFLSLSGIGSAFLAAKIPFILFSSDLLNHAGGLIGSGKTLLFGLVGGYVGIEIAKWYLGIKWKTGDSFAIPLAAAISVGRLGCFFSECCFGLPTSLPWGVHFPSVDSLTRHPVQIYESMFHATMAIVLVFAQHHRLIVGQRIKFYFLSYFVFRFFTDWLRPELRFFALSFYQWSILIFIPTFVMLWLHDQREINSQFNVCKTS